MPVYVVERDLPGIQMEQLAAAQKMAIAKSEESTADGAPVRYIRSLFIPGDSKVMCLFEAQSCDQVRDVNLAAEIPFTNIKDAMDLTP